MAIPSELTFTNELEFTERFLVPLLQRLGYPIVVNYHGTREFGKDLVFGEINRFGHVVYHGLQSKYVESISQSASKDIIDDVNEAFGNPFHHPQKATTERISTFYFANAGSISDQAVTNVFNRIGGPISPNVRLLDGKALLALDRFATFTRIEWINERLHGMLMEFRRSHENFGGLATSVERFLAGEGGFPIYRLRLAAVSAYLERPFLPSIIPYELIHTYWQRATAINEIAQSLWAPVAQERMDHGRADGMRNLCADIALESEQIEQVLTDAQNSLGPLAAI